MENRYDRYKDSGIAWIGEIPEHWEVKKGKNLFKKEERPVRDNDEIITCFRDGEVTLRSNRRTDGFTNAMKEVGYQGVRRGDLVIHNMDAFAVLLVYLILMENPLLFILFVPLKTKLMLMFTIMLIYFVPMLWEELFNL